MANLYSIADEELIKEFTRRFEYTMISKKQKMYEFPQELWGIIKDFAGVYHIGIDWFKLEKIGVDTIYFHYTEKYNAVIGNYKINVKETKKMIFNDIFKKFKTKDNLIKLYKLITDKYPKNKVLDIKCKVGDQICYVPNNGSYMCNEIIGVVTKINKATISFKPYKIAEVVRENPDTLSRYSIETIRYYFDKNKFGNVKTVKHFKLDNSDYIEKTIDWGH